MDIFCKQKFTEQYAGTAIFRQQPKKKKSVEISKDKIVLEEEHPVCGWIVCVKGPKKRQGLQ